MCFQSPVTDHSSSATGSGGLTPGQTLQPDDLSSAMETSTNLVAFVSAQKKMPQINLALGIHLLLRLKTSSKLAKQHRGSRGFVLSSTMPDLLRTYKIIVAQPPLAPTDNFKQSFSNWRLCWALPVMTSKDLNDDTFSFVVAVLVTHCSDLK
ncbi:hypothetical protein JOB18_036500 [Solea senegalensis]|uniref:Uncharacterized protein n=1 Tax=Solea senegalensis TaxID=28829 RepID=A0AAV6T9I8_SOLSE|nr:hypothetical protein JOB18_036500 [Solea senegalensis]